MILDKLNNKKFNVKCVFCGNNLKIDNSKNIENTDKIKCISCNKFNDKMYVIELTKQEIEKDITKKLKLHFSKILNSKK